MITKERAVQLVEAYLATRQWPWGDGASTPAVVHHVRELPFGWLLHWDWVKYRIEGAPRPVGGNGSHLVVDREDGSIHYVAEVWWSDEQDWEDQYLLHVRGHRAPDPLAAAVRRLHAEHGAVPALAHLRKAAPRLTLPQARAYLAAVRDGSEPPEELGDLTRPVALRPPLPIETVAGPADPL